MGQSDRTDETPLRHADFSLSEEQQAVRDAFRTALERSCPSERVEAAAAADPPGYDEKVWRQLLDMRVVAMGVPEEAGGDGAGLTELVLVAAGAIADGVIGLVGDELVLVRGDEPRRAPANHGSTPLAFWDLNAAAGRQVQVLASGGEAHELFHQATREWKLLMAAALVGLADAALRPGVEFATDRIPFR